MSKADELRSRVHDALSILSQLKNAATALVGVFDLEGGADPLPASAARDATATCVDNATRIIEVECGAGSVMGLMVEAFTEAREAGRRLPLPEGLRGEIRREAFQEAARELKQRELPIAADAVLALAGQSPPPSQTEGYTGWMLQDCEDRRSGRWFCCAGHELMTFEGKAAWAKHHALHNVGPSTTGFQVKGQVVMGHGVGGPQFENGCVCGRCAL